MVVPDDMIDALALLAYGYKRSKSGHPQRLSITELRDPLRAVCAQLGVNWHLRGRELAGFPPFNGDPRERRDT